MSPLWDILNQHSAIYYFIALMILLFSQLLLNNQLKSASMRAANDRKNSHSR
jgi:hypothetical protein